MATKPRAKSAAAKPFKPDVEKIRKGWEDAPYCFCHLLGRVSAHTKPTLGRPWCVTCGKQA